MSQPLARPIFSAAFLCLVLASPLRAQDDFQNVQMPDIKGRLAGISQTPQSPAPAAAASEDEPFSPKDCDFPLFAPQPGQPACEKITYSPAACHKFEPVFSETQAKAKSGKVCLGFVELPEKTCAEEPANIKCFLEKIPGACNYLKTSKWSPCLNEFFLECIEHGDISGGEPIWVTPPAKIPAPHSKFWTASEICHWYKNKSQWPSIEPAETR